jgi:hypothetical protein
VFNGKIFVHPHAQQTDSSQSSRNLLLGAKAQVDTKPQLEIFADDVKCAHGATVGRLDDDAVFYLRAAALGSGRAQPSHYAFGAEIVERIPLPRFAGGSMRRCSRRRRPSGHDRAPDRSEGATGARLRRRAHRADFPILELEVNGKPLVYLDNAASSQMPRQVIDRLVRYQTTQHANVNRGVHYLRRRRPSNTRKRGARSSASSTRARTAR